MVIEKQHVGRGQSGMSAKGNLNCRGEPADIINSVILHNKCSLRKVVLCCDLLHKLVFKPFVKDANGCRVAFEDLVSEGVYLVQGDSGLEHG